MIFASKEAAEEYARKINGTVVAYHILHHTEPVLVYKVVRKGN